MVPCRATSGVSSRHWRRLGCEMEVKGQRCTRNEGSEARAAVVGGYCCWINRSMEAVEALVGTRKISQVFRAGRRPTEARCSC